MPSAENVSVKENVGRAEQDSYAARSQDRYARAKADGFFAGEIQGVHNGKEFVGEDEHPGLEDPPAAGEVVLAPASTDQVSPNWR